LRERLPGAGFGAGSGDLTAIIALKPDFWPNMRVNFPLARLCGGFPGVSELCGNKL
jgi:hypothetical protein